MDTVLTQTDKKQESLNKLTKQSKILFENSIEFSIIKSYSSLKRIHHDFIELRKELPIAFIQILNVITTHNKDNELSKLIHSHSLFLKGIVSNCFTEQIFKGCIEQIEETEIINRVVIQTIQEINDFFSTFDVF